METGRVGSFLHILKRFYLIVLLFCLCVLSADSYECLFDCRCNDTSVICKDSNEIKLPLEVSWSIQYLTLQRSNLTNLTKNAFSANGTHEELHALSLRDNNIQVIESCAFCGLTRLHTLDLSHNYLISISSEALHGLNELRNLYLNNALMTSGAAQLPGALSAHNLSSLQRLELAGNRLKTMPIYGFGNLNLSTLVLTNNSLETLDKTNISNLSEFKYMSVYVSMNHFRCDCKLQEFYYWLKNGSQCADARGVLCAHPDAKRGTLVEKLSKEEMACSGDLEAVSYVFLGIVLALIGVVFLMVLYLNRRGIKRWLNNIREACRDQMEVYHYRYEQDSDPRLANVAV